MKLLFNIIIIFISVNLWGIDIDRMTAHFGAMGEAGVANPQGADNVFINLSGLTFTTHKINLGAEFDSILFNINYGSILNGKVFGSYNFGKLGALGLGINNYSVSVPENGVIFRKMRIIFGYSMEVKNLFAFGAGAEYALWNSTPETLNSVTDPVSSDSEIDLSMSFLIKYIEHGKFSVVINDLLPDNNEKTFSPDIISGISYVFKKYVFVFDIEYNDSFNLGSGIEYKITGNFFIRAGLNFQNISDGIVVASGLSYNIAGIYLEYAFIYPVNIVSYGTHKIGINYKF